MGWNLNGTENLSDLKGVTTNVIGDIIKLEISYYGVDEIPAEIGQLSSLIELYLEGDGLSEVPSEIGQLTLLESLTIFSLSSDVYPIGDRTINKISTPRFN